MKAAVLVYAAVIMGGCAGLLLYIFVCIATS